MIFELINEIFMKTEQKTLTSGCDTCRATKFETYDKFIFHECTYYFDCGIDQKLKNSDIFFPLQLLNIKNI